MKGFNTYVGLVSVCALLSTSLFAGSSDEPVKVLLKDRSIISGQAHTPRVKIPRVVQTAKRFDLQSLNMMIVDSLFNAFSYYGDTQRPFEWDPVSNTLATITRGAFPFNALPAGQRQNSSNSIKIITSNNVGSSWNAALPVFSGEDVNGNPRYPTFGIVNPNGTATSPVQLGFIFFSPMTKGTPGATWEGATVGYQQNDVTSSYVGTYLSGHDPKDGNPFQIFGSDCGLAVTAPSAENFYGSMTSTLSNGSNSTRPVEQNSNVGIIRANFETGEFTTASPASLDYTKYVPTTSATSRTNTVVASGSFNNAMYTCVFGSILSGASTENPDTLVTFGVSKSTDNGASWGAMNVLPTTVIKAYASSIGWDPDSAIFRYSFPHRVGDGDIGNAFVDSIVNSSKDMCVWGDDKYSCVGIFYNQRAGRAGIDAKVVEATFDGTQWSINTVVNEYSLFETYRFFNKFLSGTSGVYNWSSSQKGAEIQVSRTADNSKLVVKMLDVRQDIYPNGIGRRDDNGNLVAPDTLLSTDVVMTTRPSAGGAWEPRKNLTNNSLLDRITWIPSIVPNNLTIPLLSVQAAAKGSNRYEDDYLFQYRLATDTQDDFAAYKQYIRYGVADYATSPVYSPDGVVSVTETTDNANSLIIATSPNPTSDIVTIAYRSNSATAVSISVTNSLGAPVYATTLTAPSSGDISYYTFSTLSFANGAYYCTVRQGSEISTKLINVVR